MVAQSHINGLIFSSGQKYFFCTAHNISRFISWIKILSSLKIMIYSESPTGRGISLEMFDFNLNQTLHLENLNLGTDAFIVSYLKLNYFNF